MKGKAWLIAPVAMAAIGIAIVGSGLYMDGYRRGQIDYAQDKVQYTVLDGQILHFEGFVKPRLTPIKE